MSEAINPTQGWALAADQMIAGVPGTILTYQWQQSDPLDGGSFVDIPDATGESFTPGLAQVNRQLRLVVTYTDGDGSEQTLVSAETAVTGAFISGSSAGTIINGTDGADIIFGNGGADTLNGLGGDDILAGGTQNDIVNAGSGDDTINYALGQGIDAVDGGDGDDSLNVTGTAANNLLVAGLLADRVISLAGGSVSNVESVNAHLGDGIDTLSYAGTEQAVNVDLGAGTASGFVTISGVENATGGNGADLLAGSAGVVNVLNGGAGDDTFIVHDLADGVVEALDGGIDEVRSLADTYTIVNSNVENLAYAGSGNFTGTGNATANVITGGSGNDVLNGMGGNDTLNGGNGDDILDGGTGNDILNGGAGNDTLNGGAGNDAIHGEDGDDIINYAFGQGADTVDDGNGMDGGAGVDRLNIIGAITNNSIAVVVAGGVLTSVAGGALSGVESVSLDLLDGIDTVNYGGSTEGVVVDLGGSAAGFASIAGLENVVGGSGNDTLSGVVGVTNVLTGGAGDDSFVVHDTADVVSEGADGGTDHVQSHAASFTLTNANVENLSYAGEGNFTGTGNGAGNAVTGGGGDDVLSGLGGDDTLQAGAGNDTVDGGAGLDALLGGDGNDTLSGGTSNDTIYGGAGNDTIRYAIGEGADAVDGGADEDTLQVRGSATANMFGVIFDGYRLTNIAGGFVANVESVTADLGAGVDSLNYTGTVVGVSVDLGGTASGFGSITGIENVVGGSGDDRLASAADGAVNTLTGAGGNDTFVVRETADIVSEATAGGTDEVQSEAGSYTITNANVENLTYTGSDSFSGTGNNAANVITGGSGADTLSGLGGNDALHGGGGGDTLSGGSGNDTIYGGDGGDTVSYGVGEGADAVDGGLGDDRLNVSGTALANTLAVVLTGGVLTSVAGGALTSVELVSADLADGVDTLSYAGTTENVTADLGGMAAGFATIAHIENLVGGSGADTLTSAADGAVNILTGGAGNDTFIVRETADVVSESALGGTDEAQSLAGTYTITNAQVENLKYIGTGAFTGTGNGSANVISGGAHTDTLSGLAGNDTLNGGGGSDDLRGGIGNDTINGGDGDDTVSYGFGEGADAVDGGDGADSLNVTGTVLANTLVVVYAGTALASVAGGALTSVETVAVDLADGADTLSYAGTTVGISVNFAAGNASGIASVVNVENATGGSGDDHLTGKAGVANTLNGGAGNDTYVVHEDTDLVVDGGLGVDEVQSFASNYTITHAAVENLKFIGAGVFSGTGNAAANVITGGDSDDTLSGLAGNDTLNGGGGGDALSGGIGNDMLSGGDGNDTLDAGHGLDVLNGGAGDDTLDGGTGNDALNSGEGSDRVHGGDGADAVNGGIGNDFLSGGTGTDTFVFHPSFGLDRIADFDAIALGGQDRLDISALGITVANFGGSVAIAVGDYDGGVGDLDTLVSIGAETVTLLGINGVGDNAITVADFILS